MFQRQFCSYWKFSFSNQVFDESLTLRVAVMKSMLHHQELGDRINTMIAPLHGKLRFDPTYHQQITKPLIESINDSMKKILQPL